MSSEDDLVMIVTSLCFSTYSLLTECMLSFDDGLPSSLLVSSDEDEDGNCLLLELPWGAVYFLTSKSRPVIADPTAFYPILIVPPWGKP